MSIYLSIYFFITIILFVTIFNKRYLKPFTIIASIIVILFESLRWKTGTDWNPYFQLFTNPEIVTINEPLYYFLNYIVSFFFNSYTIILFIISVFSIFSIIQILNYFKLNPIFGILIYLSLIIGYWGMNRQIFSLFCAFYMYKSIVEKNNILSIFWFFVGLLFHNSFFFLFFLLFYNNKNYFKYLIFIILLLLFLPSKMYITQFFLQNFEFFLDKHTFYSDLDFGGNILFTILRRFPICALILYFMFHCHFNKILLDKSFIFFSYLYLSGFFLTLILYNILPVFVNRFSLYFMISEIFLVPYFFKKFNSSFGKLFFVSFFICFYLYVFINNINYNKDLYDPYISIFDKIDRIMY
jgi:hypothetical protein